LGVVVVVVVESVSDVVVAAFFLCFFFADELSSGLVLEVSVLAVEESALPLIEPALGFFCESGFCPLLGFCLSIESGELVCGLFAEGVCVSVVVVDWVV
jgi:hypothetical protein